VQAVNEQVIWHHDVSASVAMFLSCFFIASGVK
jgi:hypothetical protein